jgi:hypothetical protein
VAWDVDDPTTESINVTPISPAGKIGATASVVSGWAGTGSPALVTTPTGDLRIFFGGTRTTNAGEDLFGMITATSDSSGTTWGPFVNTDRRTQDFGYARVAGATFAGDTPLTTWYDADQTIVHRGLDPAVEAERFTEGTGGACCAILQNIATDTESGAVVAAWCQFNNAPDGIFAQGVDPATGKPIPPVGFMPGSATNFQGQQIHSCEVTQRTPLAARVGPGGGIYTATTTGYPETSKVLVWRIGNETSVTVADRSRKRESLKLPQLAADRNGRLWVGWIDSLGRVLVRRSNRAATVWGATVKARPPKDTVSGYALDLSAQAGKVDVIARFGSVANLQAYHRQLLPGLTLKASPTSIGRGGRRVSFRVTDAGDPVNNATVKATGESATTNANGVAKLRLGPFSRARSVTGKATKTGYVAAKARVKVR